MSFFCNLNMVQIMVIYKFKICIIIPEIAHIQLYLLLTENKMKKMLKSKFRDSSYSSKVVFFYKALI